jgi:hypothetical protein
MKGGSSTGPENLRNSSEILSKINLSKLTLLVDIITTPVHIKRTDPSKKSFQIQLKFLINSITFSSVLAQERSLKKGSPLCPSSTVKGLKRCFTRTAILSKLLVTMSASK